MTSRLNKLICSTFVILFWWNFSEWKQANIVPVYKGKDAKDVSNYRPIYMLSIVSKLAERSLNNHILYPHISDLLCKSQHGFLKGKSTCTQLVQCIDSVSDSLDNGIQTYIIYMDFSKAFDSVPHAMLLTNLHTVNMNSVVFT